LEEGLKMDKFAALPKKTAVQLSLFDIKKPLIGVGWFPKKIKYTQKEQAGNPYLGIDYSDPSSIRRHASYAKWLAQKKPGSNDPFEKLRKHFPKQ
jgi:hypothetical protein